MIPHGPHRTQFLFQNSRHRLVRHLRIKDMKARPMPLARQAIMDLMLLSGNPVMLSKRVCISHLSFSCKRSPVYLLAYFVRLALHQVGPSHTLLCTTAATSAYSSKHLPCCYAMKLPSQFFQSCEHVCQECVCRAILSWNIALFFSNFFDEKHISCTCFFHAQTCTVYAPKWSFHAWFRHSHFQRPFCFFDHGKKNVLRPVHWGSLLLHLDILLGWSAKVVEFCTATHTKM